MSILENLQGMLAKGQDNALLRFSLGSEFLKIDDPASAAPHLSAAIAHDAEYSAAWKLLGKAQLALGRNDEAITTFQRGIEVAEGKGDAQAVKEMNVFLKRAMRGA